MPLYCSFVGWSGSGKTNLLRAVIGQLVADGLRVGALKATHHDVRLDTRGKDSYSFCEAGAETVVLTAATQTTVFLPSEFLHGERLAQLFGGLQIVIGESRIFSEGLRFEVAAGVEELSGLKRPAEELDALVTDNGALADAAHRCGIEVFGRDQGRAVAQFIRRHYESLGL